MADFIRGQLLAKGDAEVLAGHKEAANLASPTEVAINAAEVSVIEQLSDLTGPIVSVVFAANSRWANSVWFLRGTIDRVIATTSR